MLRLSRFADYGAQIMVYMAKDGTVHSAHAVASDLGLAVATVSKILKMLSKTNLVISALGAKGGYRLAHDPHDISIAEIIYAMDGPISITECSGETVCTRESMCATRDSWQGINRIIQDALEKVSLAEMTKPQLQVVDVSALRERVKST